MFCPKCGTQNPENGRFCRSCGTNLTPVSDALSGKLAAKSQGFGMMQAIEPPCLIGEKGKPITLEGALGKLFMGFAFLVVTFILAFTRMGRNWWFWMLIPAFAMIGGGIAQYLQLRKHDRKNNSGAAEPTKNFAPVSNDSLPPAQTDYIPPAVEESHYKTGDLVPPSVTEETTRQLEINQEGETMTLPPRK